MTTDKDMAIVDSEAAATSAEVALSTINIEDEALDSGDYERPAVTLKQKNSEIGDFPDGNFILQKELDLGKLIEIVFLKKTRDFVEDREYQDPQMPKNFTSVSAARKAGFEIDYSDKPWVWRRLTTVCLVKGTSPAFFQHKHDTNCYAMTEYVFNNTAYKAAAMRINADFLVIEQTSKLPLSVLRYNMGSVLKKFQKGSAYVPTLTLLDNNDTAFIEFAQKLLI